MVGAVFAQDAAPAPDAFSGYLNTGSSMILELM